MAFEFKITEKREHPSKYGGSPHRALMAEIGDFAKQHRKHSLRRFAGMDADEAPMEPEREMGSEGCEACKAGECDDPEHMSEDERGGLEKMLGEEKRSDDHDYDE